MSSTNTDLPGMRSRPSSLVSPRLARSRSRTQSISSDRPSTIGNGLASPPQSVSPAPAFIAASAASQIVTNDHDAHADSWYDESGLLPAGETALVSPEALTLVNSFLDQLLFNFLHVAKATTLAALRPAVTDVLKPKLAKDAIGNADDELREYLGGADEDDFVQPQPHAPGQTSHDAARDWDVELVWKRTRLRCMVYSSLGDMEEEEEDTYMEQEHLEIGDHESPADVISPAVAIFLTSVLEYMGELTLTVAGQAAYLRLRSVHDKELKEGSRSPADLADRIVVGESDMERVALDRTLGRLWRGWKKRIRPVTIMDVHRSFSRASSRHARQGSSATDLLSLKPTYSNEEEEAEAEAEAAAAAAQKSQQQQQQQQEREPHDVPLPLSTNDVNEIEVPGLVSYSDDDSSSDDADDDTFARRPKSFYHGAASRPGKVKHMRSSSLPTFPSKFDTTSPLSDEDDKDAPEEEHFEEARTVQPTTSSTSLAAEPDMPTIAEVNEANAAADDSKRRAEPPAPIDTNAAAAQDLDGLDDATYEQAEVVKSPRASISSHDSRRDATARIIDVPAPKSHASSRSSSLDATRRRSTSQPRSGTSPAPAASSTETGATAGVAAGAAIAAGAAATAAVAAKSSVHTDAISESDEDEEQPIPRSRNLTATLPRSSSLPGHHNHHKIHSHFIEETIPEVPPPIPSQHAGRSASKEATPDDGSLLPIQSNSSSQQRQLQTSTSGSSTNSSKQHKATKTSDDNRDVARNFEELMKSNQTITYTLTPENMRNMDVSAAPLPWCSFFFSHLTSVFSPLVPLP